jgi:cytochrome P450
MFQVDLNSPQFLADPYPYPYPTFKRLRESAPIHALMPGIWLATRYAEADRILRDPPAWQKDYLSGVAKRYGPQAADEPVFRMVNRFMLLSPVRRYPIPIQR